MQGLSPVVQNQFYFLFDVGHRMALLEVALQIGDAVGIVNGLLRIGGSQKHKRHGLSPQVIGFINPFFQFNAICPWQVDVTND